MLTLARRLTPVALVCALTIGSMLPAAYGEEVDETTDFTTTVETMREAGVGFGAIVHLTNLASQLDMDALELLETIPVVDGEFDFNFGEIKQQLDPEQRAALKMQAKAFRELVKAAKAELKAQNKLAEGEENEENQEDDTDLSVDEALESDESLEDPASAETKAMLIADAFDMDPADVTALREEGHGWGALFRLASFATAAGVSVQELVGGDDSASQGLGLGKLRKMLTAEQLAELEKGPRNFGHLVSGKSEAPGKSGKAKKPKKHQDTEG